jgi:hypothetical protein
MSTIHDDLNTHLSRDQTAKEPTGIEASSDFFRGINFLPGEDPQDYMKLKAALFAEHKPRGRSQEKLVKSVAKALWKIGRAQRPCLDLELAIDWREPAATDQTKPSAE